MFTPGMIARLMTEDVQDTYPVLKETATGMLWHRRQQHGTKFRDDTPLGIVLDFIRDAGKATRYDLQAFLDQLQNSIAEHANAMYDDSVAIMIRIHQESNYQLDDPRVDWLDLKLNEIRNLLTRVVPVIRRSQAQARSLDHAKDLLQRHRERLIAAIQEIEQEAPEGIEEVMDEVHTVAGGILEACDVIGNEVLEMIW